MINLFYITNSIAEAKIVDKLDIDWIFIDLETVGKKNRQIGRNTVMSDHSISDVYKIRSVINNTKILLRCNPIGDHSREEIDEINRTTGIDMVMLPFFKTVEEVEIFIELLDTSKAEPCLLIETRSALDNLNDILKVYPFKYVHIGLNDIHIERNTSFMFEPFVDGLLDTAISILRSSNIKFGIGGIGKIGSELLPTPECVINEHTRLKSSGVILSRSFKGNFSEESKEHFEAELIQSVSKFRKHEIYSSKLDENQLLESYVLMQNDIFKVVKTINQNKYNNLDFNIDVNLNKILLSKQIKDKNVLIIGGAGSIGSNYTKQILKFKPSKVTIVDSNENGLTELTRDLRSSNSLDYGPEYITYPVNLLSDTFNKIFSSNKWQVVANFSAHKHVRSEKDKISVEALIENNVFGCIKLLELCEAYPPNYFFSVSTDKATNPVNIMGASKSLMEKLILSRKDRFRVSTARFANVAFSNGSLLDGFIYRLEKSQPLSCPEDIKRFFVTPEQSGEICLLATFLGDTGNIFFPKLDFYKDQIFFKDIALDFLKEKGLEPVLVNSEKLAKDFEFLRYPKKYPIYFFKTDTSGEKSYEEFYTKEEDYNTDEHKTLGFINPLKFEMSFNQVKKDFLVVFNEPNSTKLDIVNVIKKYVPDFKHVETGKNLDQKM
tara:strand:- start:231 stop:2219 length:1989 start_codon:yes stop_codon:yes gene_type:complete